MSDAGAEVGITVTAKDTTGPAFDSAKKGADGLAKSTKGLQDQVKQISPHAGKASAAMMAMRGVAGQTGGKFADLTNRMGGLLEIVVAGGPLGIGIAAVTGAVALFGQALAITTQDIREQKEALKELEEQNKTLEERVQARREALLKSVVGETEFRKNEIAAQIAAEKDRIQELDANMARERQIIEKQMSNLESMSKQERAAVEVTIKKRQEAFAATKKESEEKIRLLQQDLGLLEIQTELTTTAAARERERADILAQLKEQKVANNEADKEAIELLKEIEEIRNRELEIIERKQAAIEEFSARRIEAIEKQHALEESINLANAKNAEDEQNRQFAIAEATASAAGTIASSIAKASGDAKAAQVASAMSQIVIQAATGAAKSIAAYAEIPFVGIALGVAQAASLVASVMALASDIQGAAMGGLVTGGIPGRDSVLVNTQRNELILPPDLSSALMGGSGKGGLAPLPPGVRDRIEGGGGGGGGGGGTVAVNIQTGFIPHAQEGRKFARAQAKQIATAIDRGQAGRLGRKFKKVR